jgi:hypothetical protein
MTGLGQKLAGANGRALDGGRAGWLAKRWFG